ncbi:hypothetical protein LCGC14_1378590 [marine sediment metagenome]|uniref:MULE transposase domain-containing protein n=1 Tax=marine sediment metagenome TaxID=412755 RepID=A0A0F9N4Z5_9ZZZZ
MPAKPTEIKAPTIYTYWDSNEGFTCPLCSSKLHHEFNDGGRKVITMKGSLWVVTNYYSCTNSECEMHEAFPAAYHSTLLRKQFSLDVWAKVIQHHFKHHINYSTIVELMWDDWEVSISRGTVRNICHYFEMAGKQYQDEIVLNEVKANGKIVLSLDGAQPVKKEPSLWVFSDRLTGHVLLATNVESAPAGVLSGFFRQIEESYRVPIIAVISDKQKNIVNAVKQFNPDLPHGYCQYHFLNHVVGPIASKDSHLKKTLRKAVKELSIVQNCKLKDSNPLYKLFYPISEELKCAVATKGDRFKIFPGLEAFLNLEHVVSQLDKFESSNLPPKVSRSLIALLNSLETLLQENRYIKEEIITLIPEFTQIRSILGKREKTASQIMKEVKKWTYKLQIRLKRRKLVFDHEKIKWQQPSFKLSCEEIWQQWIRLVNSYCEGLYTAYDVKELEFTNNAKEQLFNRSKHHFRALLGRENVANAFLNHGALHVQLLDVDYSKKNVSKVLLACETPLIESQRRKFHAQYAMVRRTWKIREVDTGNIAQFKVNIMQLEGF